MAQMACLMCSWQEIAAYLGVSVRAVQRWERRGLPIRRTNNRELLMIVTDELEAWLEKHGGRFAGNPYSVPQGGPSCSILGREIEDIPLE